jgi:hypothetical protein
VTTSHSFIEAGSSAGSYHGLELRVQCASELLTQEHKDAVLQSRSQWLSRSHLSEDVYSTGRWLCLLPRSLGVVKALYLPLWSIPPFLKPCSRS